MKNKNIPRAVLAGLLTISAALFWSTCIAMAGAYTPPGDAGSPNDDGNTPMGDAGTRLEEIMDRGSGRNDSL